MKQFFSRTTVFGIATAAFIVSANAERLEDAQGAYSQHTLNGNNVEIGCDRWKNEPDKVIDGTERYVFHGGGAGIVTAFNSGKEAIALAISSLVNHPFVPKHRKTELAEKYEGFAERMDNSKTDQERALVLEDLVKFSHNREFEKFKEDNGIDFFDSLRRDCP